MIKKLLLTLLIFTYAIALNAQDARPYVNTLEDFYMHMKNHVENVNRMGDVIIEELKANPEKWRKAFNIPAGTVIDEPLTNEIKEFLSIHDASKLNTTKAFLKKINRGNGIINDLYKVYAKKYDNMSEGEKKIVTELNRVDAVERADFIKKYNLPQWKIDLIDSIEKMADGVERGMNLVTPEEMSKVVWKESEAAQKKLDEAIKNKSTPEIIEKLKLKLELTLHVEKKYLTEAVTLPQFKERMIKIQSALKDAGIAAENLDEFSSYRLIDTYEKRMKTKINPADPRLAKKFKTFFFANAGGLVLLKESTNPARRKESAVMIENGRNDLKFLPKEKAFETFDTSCSYMYQQL